MTYHITSAEDVDGRSLVGKKIDDDTECEPQVGKGEPGEDQCEDVVLEGREKDR